MEALLLDWCQSPGSKDPSLQRVHGNLLIINSRNDSMGKIVSAHSSSGSACHFPLSQAAICKFCSYLAMTQFCGFIC